MIAGMENVRSASHPTVESRQEPERDTEQQRDGQCFGNAQ
jgi:hypothetical protein